MSSKIKIQPNLTERAILIKVVCSRWGARRFEKGVTEEISLAHGAEADQLSVTKRLVAKHGTKKVEQTIYAVRKHWADNTLPWDRDGWSLLPTKNYFNFMKRHRELVAEFEVSVDELCYTNYEALKLEAQALLNGLYREADYPKADDLRRSYEVRSDYMPVPTAGDFRAALPDSELAKIRAQVEETTQQRIGEAVQALYERVAETVENVRKRLAAYEPGSKGEKPQHAFHKDILDRLQELAELVPNLNLTGDPKLDQLAKRIQKSFGDLDAKQLKESDAVREAAIDEADAILKKMAGMFGGVS